MLVRNVLLYERSRSEELRTRLASEFAFIFLLYERFNRLGQLTGHGH